MDKLTVTKLAYCVDCRVGRLLPYRTVADPPTVDWLRNMAKLEAGVLSLSQVGGTFRFRTGVIRNLVEWGSHWGLEVLPGSGPVYEQYIAHRLLVQGVSVATLDHDFTTISVFHSTMRSLLPGLWWHNPTRQDVIRLFVKYLVKDVKLPARVTVPCAYGSFVKMVLALDPNVPRELHMRVVLQTMGLPGLRRVAAANLVIKRVAGKRTIQCTACSDVWIEWSEEFGWCVALYINVDKNIRGGKFRWVWIPGKMRSGLTYGDDVRRWLLEYDVPDGPFLAAPTGARANRFSTTKYTGFDRCVAKAWAKTFPELSGVKMHPYSLRKMMIQALVEQMRLIQAYKTKIAAMAATRRPMDQRIVDRYSTMPFTAADVGEFIGWVSTKTTVMKHYCGLSKDHMLRMLSEMDPAELPQEVVTTGVGPNVWRRSA
jgi:hypothetical protein